MWRIRFARAPYLTKFASEILYWTFAMAQNEKPLRVAELITSLFLALDIGLGQPIDMLLSDYVKKLEWKSA